MIERKHESRIIFRPERSKICFVLKTAAVSSAVGNKTNIKIRPSGFRFLRREKSFVVFAAVDWKRFNARDILHFSTKKKNDGRKNYERRGRRGNPEGAFVVRLQNPLEEGSGIVVTRVISDRTKRPGSFLRAK